MRARRSLRATASIIGTATILLSAAASQASAAPQIRFLHAIPGGPTANLQVKGASGPSATLSGVSFAKTSSYAPGPSGRVTATLLAGGKALGKGTATLGSSGRYTFVAGKDKSGKPEIKVFASGPATAGKARVRALHFAPEVPKADFKLGNRDLGTLDEGQAGQYVSVEPGTYPIEAMPPGSKDAVVMDKNVSLSAGTASTAYALGSGGEATKFVVVQDSVAAPSGGPATGLGGLSGDDTPWLAALLAALVAGSLGGLAFTRVYARGGRVRS
jgi:uncharacterized protein DUF4397